MSPALIVPALNDLRVDARRCNSRPTAEFTKVGGIDAKSLDELGATGMRFGGHFQRPPWPTCSHVPAGQVRIGQIDVDDTADRRRAASVLCAAPPGRPPAEFMMLICMSGCGDPSAVRRLVRWRQTVADQAFENVQFGMFQHFTHADRWPTHNHLQHPAVAR
jgi:hypothetical protein